MLAGVNPLERRMPNLNPLTEKQLRDAERDKVYIFNVSPRQHGPMTIYGKMYTIPARKDGEEVSEPLVIPGTVYETGIKKVIPPLHVEHEWIAYDGMAVAREIVGTAPFLDASQNLVPYGVFIDTTPNPSQDKIDAAKEEWLQRCSERVADGDRLASINNGIVDVGGGRTASNIGKDHREALKELGLKRPWAEKNQKMLVCEECGEANQPTAARCKNPDCRAIFDEAKARQRYPEMFAHERAKPGPKPKNEEVAA